MNMKHFYRDAIDAAYMAKKFGMEFIDPITGRIEPSDIGTALFSRGYVHPDSLHLLEPQKNDLTLHNNLYCNCWIRKQIKEPQPKEGHPDYDPDNIVYEYILVCSTPDHPSAFYPIHYIRRMNVPIEIIRRNGIPFIWPESEE